MSFVLKIKDALTGRPYEVEGIDESESSAYYNAYFGVPMVMPLAIKSRDSGGFWKLPFEPYITVSGKNILIKRNVSKAERAGSIKERWALDDYVITIEGYFLNPESTYYPDEDVKKLREICETPKPVDVICPLFEALGITSIAIENFDFPFTKGEAAQDWIIKGVSDTDWNLLEESDKYVS